MEYKLPIYKDEYRSPDYIGTVTSKNDPSLLNMRKNMRASNANARKYIRSYYERTGEMPKFIKIERIQLMARGPRTKHSLNDFGTRRSYDQSLPHRYATHFDVYRRRDTYAEWLFQYLMDHNLTPSQFNLIQQMERKKMWIEVDIARELRKKGIASYGTRTGTRYEGIE